MIHIRSTGEVQKISRACQIVKETLEIIQEMIVPGISTLELDIEAEKFIRSKGAQPGFKGLYGYPATLCVSVEDEVVMEYRTIGNYKMERLFPLMWVV